MSNREEMEGRSQMEFEYRDSLPEDGKFRLTWFSYKNADKSVEFKHDVSTFLREEMKKISSDMNLSTITKLKEGMNLPNLEFTFLPTFIYSI